MFHLGGSGLPFQIFLPLFYYSPDYFTIIWSFVLVAIGIRQLQEIRTWRAVLAILIPFIILGLVYGVTAFVLYGHWTSVIEFLV